jgi:hypothetical protein
VALLLVLAGVAQVAGFTAERFSFLAVAVLMPALSVALSRGLPTRLAARLEPRLGERLHERYWRTLLTAVALAFLPVAVVLAPTAYAVLDAPGLAALSPGCSLFSDDGTGSAAVLVRPDVKPMIDGRLDYWGPARMIEVRDVLWRPLPLTLVPAAANCVALPAGSYPALAQALGASPAWRATGSTGPVRSWVRR